MVQTTTAPAAGEELGVCLASMSFYPLYAGPAVRFQRYAPGLLRQRVRMQVFTQAVTPDLIARDGSLAATNGKNGHASPAGWPLHEVVEGLPIYRTELPANRRRHARYFHDLAAHCESHADKVDVVQLLNVDLSAFWAIRKLRRLGIPTVFTSTLLASFSPAAWKRSLQRVRRRLPLDLVDQLVVSSSVMKSDLQALGTSAAIEVIPNGVDTKRFRPAADPGERAALRHKLGLKGPGPFVLGIGPVIPRKGTDALVEAFCRVAHRHPEATLVLVGPRHDLERPVLAEFRDRIQNLLREHGVADRVLFTGAVRGVEEYLRACDIFAFTSRREGMPNVIGEAMASGLPVLTTPFIGLPAEFGSAGEQYVLSDWASEPLAADLDSFLESDRKRRDFGAAARRWAVEKLDVELSLRSYADLYRELKRRGCR